MFYVTEIIKYILRNMFYNILVFKNIKHRYEHKVYLLKIV